MRTQKSARRSRRGLRQGSTALAATLIAGVSTVVTGAQPASAAPSAPSFGPAIDGYQPYDGQDTCDPAAKPGVLDFQRLVLAAYPGTGDSGIRRECNVGGTSEHKEGRAWDWRVSAFTQPQTANDLLNWLLATDRHGNAHALARRFGIMYIIYNARIWKSYEAGAGWQPYSCSGVTDCHQDHVHFSFSWAGALRRTTWWDAQPEPRPIGTVTVGFYEPGDSTWHLTNDNTGPSDALFAWGGPNNGMIPLSGDWNGDGKTTIGFYRPSDASWHLTNDNSGASDAAFVWGPPNMVPVVGDWNGDGKTTVGFYRPSDSTWHLTNDNSGASDLAFVWGGPNNGMVPVAGDWDGDGRTTVGFYRAGDASWHLTNDNVGPSDSAFVWGPPGMRPVVGDWNGDGKTTVGFYRPSDSSWHLTNDNSGASDAAFVWGAPNNGMIPVVGDWNSA